MARLIERAGVPTTVNLVPTLLAQLEALADGRGEDPYLLLGTRPADGLDEAAALFILDNFFPRQHETMVRPVERYAELHELRSPGRRARSTSSPATSRGAAPGGSTRRRLRSPTVLRKGI